MVPPGENLYLWIHYDQLLTRENNQFAYQTHINPADQVEQFEITGKKLFKHLKHCITVPMWALMSVQSFDCSLLRRKG